MKTNKIKEINIKHIFAMLSVVLAIFFAVNSLEAQPIGCANFPCSDSAPWAEDVVIECQSLECPSCVWEVTFNWRMIYCNGKHRLQVNLTEITPKDYWQCMDENLCGDWGSRANILADGLASFLDWIKYQPLFSYAEIVEYSYGQCWKYNGYESPSGSIMQWVRCPTNSCCIWVFQSEYNSQTLQLELSDPVLIEPSFYDCNMFDIEDIFQTNFCYSFCGFMDPFFGVLLAKASIRYISMSKPDIYPNPANNEITIETTFSEDGIVRFDIYDLDGALLIISPEFSTIQGTYIIDVTKLKSGTYYYNIILNNNNNVYGSKFAIKK